MFEIIQCLNNIQMSQRRTSTHNFIEIKAIKQLVDLIVRQGLTYARAAKKLRIKLSTAKLIVRKFKETGSYFDPTTKTYQIPQLPLEHREHREPEQRLNPTVPSEAGPSNSDQGNNTFPFLQPQIQFPNCCFSQVQQFPWEFCNPVFQPVEAPTYCWFFSNIQS